jgi:citrate lyase alpha subunit
MKNNSQNQFITRIGLSRFLTVITLSLVGTYVGVTVQTISLVNERKEIREEVRQTQIAISDLEVNYFELAQSIDEGTIQELGFTESVVPVFAYTRDTYPTVALSR